RALKQDETTPALPWLKSEWIGRQLRRHGMASDKVYRKRLHGAHLRIAPLTDTYLADVIRRHGPLPSARDPLDFCQKCNGCRYATNHCEIAVKRRVAGVRVH